MVKVNRKNVKRLRDIKANPNLALLNFMNEMETRLGSMVKAEVSVFIEETFTKHIQSLKGDDGKDGVSVAGPRGPVGIIGPQGPPGLEVPGDQGERGNTGEKGDSGNTGNPGKDGSPDEPQDIKSKLETLEGGRRLDVSAIKNIDDFVNKIIRGFQGGALLRGKGSGSGRGAKGGGGSFVQVIDLTALTDGSTKVFTVPPNNGISSTLLQSTQFPRTYRPTTDYTLTGRKNVTLTLTGEVGAPQTGQTLLLYYVAA